EVILLGIRKFALHRFLFLSADAAWMAPVTDALLFVIAGLGLLLLRWILPRRIPLPPTLLFAALASFTLLLMYDPLSKPAAALLSLGIAVQATRMAGRRSDGFMRLVRRTTPALAALVLITGLGVRALIGMDRRRSGAAAAESRGAPNVLLIVLDTVRAWSLGLYGYYRPTSPELGRWMSDGTRFQTALSTAPWTLPSHASMFTGRFPFELSAGWLSPLDGKFPTLAEVLSARGYAAAGFVANTTYCSYESGLARGFGHFEDYPVSIPQMLFSSSLGKVLAGSRFTRRKLLRVTAEDIDNRVLAWLNQRPSDRPFFVFLNYLDTHNPYQPPPPYDTLFSDSTTASVVDSIREDTPARRWSPEELRAAVGEYDESLAYLDAQLGRLFAELKRRGLWDNTVVIVTSDHGEEFGEHRVFFHGNSLYRPALEVPLLVRFPGHVPAGLVVRTPVSLRDMAATVMDLSGGAAGQFPGRSLARFWNGTVSDSAPSADTLLMELGYSPRLPRATPIARGPMKSVVLNGHRLIRNGDGQLELYDFLRDTMELTDLARDSSYQAVLNQSFKALEAMTPIPPVMRARPPGKP
ncbi:MAG: sulfatase, partial [Gemmatimonadota bacterium]